MKNGEIFSMINMDHSVCIDEAASLDCDLTKKVYEILQSDCLINSAKIMVLVCDQTVYLEGTVASENERNIAFAAVANIFGVRNVVNYLTFPCPFLGRNSA